MHQWTCQTSGQIFKPITKSPKASRHFNKVQGHTSIFSLVYKKMGNEVLKPTRTFYFKKSALCPTLYTQFTLLSVFSSWIYCYFTTLNANKGKKSLHLCFSKWDSKPQYWQHLQRQGNRRQLHRSEVTQNLELVLQSKPRPLVTFPPQRYLLL